MKTFFRLLALMFALIFCCSCFAACDFHDEKQEGTDPGTEQGKENTAETPTYEGFMIDEKKASFRVVIPDKSTASVELALETLLAAFETKTGVRPDVVTDYLQKDQSYDESTYEILLGRTQRNESREVLSALENGQFSIQTIGKKIVITAPADAMIMDAVDYFLTCCVDTMSKNESVYSLAATDYTNEVVMDSSVLTINGNILDGYTIIYDSRGPEFESLAVELANRMKVLGHEVAIARDIEIPETDGAKEILIGETNRSVSTEIYEQTQVKLLSFKLVVKGSYLQIACGGAYSARMCLTNMYSRFFEAKNKAFTDGEYFFTDLNVADIALADGADLRIMTSNVLFGYTTDNYWKVYERAEVYAAGLAGTQPDAVGLQEGENGWIKCLPYYLNYLKKHYDMDYEWLFYDWRSPYQVSANVTNGQTTTSIIYRKDKYELVASDIENCAWYTSTARNIRLVCWAYLRDRNNPEHDFVILNTHWGFNTEAAGQTSRDQSVQLSIDKVNYLKETYPGVPIFHTGDFNSPESTVVYYSTEGAEYVEKFLPDTGCSDSMLTAKANGVLVNDCGGMGGPGQKRGGGGDKENRYIDHIAYYGSNVEILRFESLNNNLNIWCSDHLPMIADYGIWD